MNNAIGFFGLSVTNWQSPPTAPPKCLSFAARNPDNQTAITVGFFNELTSERKGDGSSQQSARFAQQAKTNPSRCGSTSWH